MQVLFSEGNYPFVNIVQEHDRFSITWNFSTLYHNQVLKYLLYFNCEFILDTSATKWILVGYGLRIDITKSYPVCFQICWQSEVEPDVKILFLEDNFILELRKIINTYMFLSGWCEATSWGELLFCCHFSTVFVMVSLQAKSSCVGDVLKSTVSELLAIVLIPNSPSVCSITDI